MFFLIMQKCTLAESNSNLLDELQFFHDEFFFYG